MTDHTVGAAGTRHVGDLLSEYLNGDLGAAERETVETHLRECSRCTADLHTLRLTVSAVRRLPLAPIPRSFAIRAPERTNKPVTNFLRWTTSALAAALVLFLAVGVILPAVAPELALRPAATATPPVAPLLAPARRVASGSAPSRDVVELTATGQANVQSAAAAAPTSTTAPAAAAPAAAPAGSGEAPPKPTTAGFVQSATTSNDATQTQAPQPLGAAAVTSQAAVATPSTESYPSSAQPQVSTPATTSYPAPTQPLVPTPSAASYPNASQSRVIPTPSAAGYPDSSQPAVISTPVPQGAYPADTSDGQNPAASAGSSSAAVTTPIPAAGRPATTWFTPALGLLVALALVTAIAMTWLSRRGH
jgi:hypothetical protein